MCHILQLLHLSSLSSVFCIWIGKGLVWFHLRLSLTSLMFLTSCICKSGLLTTLGKSSANIFSNSFFHVNLFLFLSHYVDYHCHRFWRSFSLRSLNWVISTYPVFKFTNPSPLTSILLLSWSGELLFHLLHFSLPWFPLGYFILFFFTFPISVENSNLVFHLYFFLWPLRAWW